MTHSQVEQKESKSTRVFLLLLCQIFASFYQVCVCGNARIQDGLQAEVVAICLNGRRIFWLVRRGSCLGESLQNLRHLQGFVCFERKKFLVNVLPAPS